MAIDRPVQKSGARSQELGFFWEVSHLGTGIQGLGPVSAAFLGALAGICIRSGGDRPQTGADMGCWKTM